MSPLSPPPPLPPTSLLGCCAFSLSLSLSVCVCVCVCVFMLSAFSLCLSMCPPVRAWFCHHMYVCTHVWWGLSVAPECPHVGGVWHHHHHCTPSLLRTTILLATACLWLMWIVTFMSQMYPIIIPNFSTRPNITHT